MSEISRIGATPTNRTEGVARAGARQDRSAGAQTRTERGEDRVEVSSLARLLQQLRDVPDVREDLVERVRAQVEAGTYLTPDKLDAALDEMIADERSLPGA